MVFSKLNYCPYCGKKFYRVNVLQLNFCCFCGSKLNKTKDFLPKEAQCTICHESMSLKKKIYIKCSYCGSHYHSSCITSWLLEYNSCPMCLNVFLMPKI